MHELLSCAIAGGNPVIFPETLSGCGGTPEIHETLSGIRQVLQSAHFYASRQEDQSGALPRTPPGQDADCCIDFASISDALSTLPSPPTLVVELLKTFSDENLSVNVLAKKVAIDQAMVARLLRVANSSFYGLQGKVMTVADAILILGTGNVRNLILTVSVSNSISTHSLQNNTNFHSFWMHGVATAICAEKLAKRMGCDPGGAFSAGLLHDIGRIVLAIHFPLHYEKVVRYHHQIDCLLFEAEKKLLGVSHASIGEYLCKRWKFPLELCAAVAGHHNPELIGNNASLVSVVHLADAMVHAQALANNNVGMMPPIYSPSWERAGLSWTDCQEILDEVVNGVTKFSQLLGIASPLPLVKCIPNPILSITNDVPPF